MIIYIYGSDNFKKDIHKVLDHSNIKFRLDEHGEIVNLETLDELKDAIEDNPNNIYLIDDSKIIKKNSINQKIKFLQPKDAINQEYLLDHGIGDVSVDSIEELSTHIIKKLESMDLNEDEEIQDSIIEIVEDAYEKDSDEETTSYQLDDELSALLSSANDEDEAISYEEGIQEEEKKETSDEEILNSVEAVDEISFLLGDNGEDKEAAESNDENDEENEELPSLGELSFEEYFDSITQEESTEEENIEKDKEENNKIYIEDVPQGEKMADEFSEFDTLSENDILAALNGLDNVSITNEKKDNLPSSESSESKSESLNISSSNSEDIAKLITQLLNNKTLEITIKVKD